MTFTGYRLDLSRVKLVFCDFDDTLCIHLSNNVTRPTSEQYRQCRLKNGIYVYTETFSDVVVPNEFLHKWLLKYMKGIEKYVISWTDSGF